MPMMSSLGESILSRSIRGSATITSPALSSAIRITPSSITRDSAPMMSLSSASASVSINSALESGPGWMNSAIFCRKVRRSSFSAEARSGCGSDTALGCRTCGSGGTNRIAEERGSHAGRRGSPEPRVCPAVAAELVRYRRSAGGLVASLAHALPDFLHAGQEVPEILGLYLQAIVALGQLLCQQFNHPAVQRGRRQAKVGIGLAAR